ncbi:MAG: peptidoglycan editing factor PgeF [Deltaproteobacteria bacterium]|nr:peptidoglycan editing factor PgeF [Deltaproteobacteria bacterium]
MALTHIQNIPVVQSPLLLKQEWLVHGFGLKDIPIEKYVNAAGFEKSWIPKTHQPHGNRVHVVQRTSDPNGAGIGHRVMEGDAFVTDQPGVVCWVRTADCLPIIIVDVEKKVVGAVHAGWRSTAQKIISETLAVFKTKWNSNVADLRVALGPAIGGHCYHVGPDVAKIFTEAGLCPGPWMEEMDRGHWFLDLAFANLHLLHEAGLEREQVYVSLACTACDLERFHSFRKEGGKKGEQVSFVIVR